MQDFLDEEWRQVFAANGITGFDSLWNLEAGWFEEPNRRRNGWSGVSRLPLVLPDGQTTAVFLKRQENHNTFSWRHPFRGEPTFAREFRHLLRYRACLVPTLEPIFFATRILAGASRAILVTRELAGFVPLNLWSEMPHPRAIRVACVQAVAALLQGMHRHGIQHNCLYPKHVFVRDMPDGRVEARVIDLEKSRWRPFATLCALRDLDTLNRYAEGWRQTERLRFLESYLGTPRLTAHAKWLWRALAARKARKARSRI